MSLAYIIDGYNIINHPLFARAHKKIKNPLNSLSDFIKIKRLCGSLKNKVIIVFDGYCPKGQEPSRAGAGFSLVFSQESSADERIKSMLETAEDRKNIVVVSDDKEIRLFAKYSRVKSIGVEEFFAPAFQVSANASRTQKNLSKQELNYSQVNKINEELKKLWLK